MQIVQRAYSGEADRRRIVALVRATAAHNLHVTDLPYRLSSPALDLPDNVALWTDKTGQLVAWAMMLTPMWVVEFATLTRPDAVTIEGEILAWADARARATVGTPYGRPMWFVNVRDDQHDRIRALEAAGFACQSDAPMNPWRKVFLKHAGPSALTPCPLPPQITLRPLAGQSEVDACVELHRAAFGSDNMTPAWRSRVLQAPEYRPELDLVAATPEGRLAAFCVGWLSTHGTPETLYGQIEPMGVHPEYQKQGLGAAMLTAMLDRLYRQGASEIYVEADDGDAGATGFYLSAGFQVAHRVLVYRKDYATGS